VLVFGRYDPAPGRTWMVTAANKAERLTVPGTHQDLGVGGLASDSHGVWLQGGEGIYLWRHRYGLTLVSENGAMPAGVCA